MKAINKKERISRLKEGKQVVTKNDFLHTSLHLFMHFSLWRVLSLGILEGDTMVTTHR